VTARGVTRTDSILDRIVAQLRAVRERQKLDEPESLLRELAQSQGPQWPLTRAIVSPRGNAPASAAVQIIAEVKKASPSRGVLAPRLDHVAVARAYARGGAAGVSVVTEPNYFRGHVTWLDEIRKALSQEFGEARPSILRKDFIVDPYQVLQSRAYGADNVLLIAALLEESLLREFIGQAEELGMDALVEVHTQAEAERAVRAGATLFGINNRDLHTFEVDLATTERIRPLLPEDAVVIGESGVHTRKDVERLQRAGVQAILVGEAFMTAPDVAAKMAELRV
jgi:indole-3-glycerol phosphate synthase